MLKAITKVVVIAAVVGFLSGCETLKGAKKDAESVPVMVEHGYQKAVKVDKWMQDNWW
ncbi:MAG: hypothetical protein HQL16_07395 [Candidatus Omnitrophica bacterium]|nr:hypothetical protein [Candidatus Omnitrophota bacterium]